MSRQSENAYLMMSKNKEWKLFYLKMDKPFRIVLNKKWRNWDISSSHFFIKELIFLKYGCLMNVNCTGSYEIDKIKVEFMK